jgi:sulfur relay (sulfurtransferase) complex TusBCD TusD component (DsrE family)
MVQKKKIRICRDCDNQIIGRDLRSWLCTSCHEKSIKPFSFKICHDCNNEITDRDLRARFCFPCSDKRPIKNGQIKSASLVAKAIKEGKLRPVKEFMCVDCGKQATDYDHRDYNKPLDVVPVCRSCNVRRGAAIPLKTDLSTKE